MVVGLQLKKVDVGDKINLVDNKVIIVDDVVDVQEVENVLELEGEFDNNDWVLDGDEDEYVYEDDDV